MYVVTLITIDWIEKKVLISVVGVYLAVVDKFLANT